MDSQAVSAQDFEQIQVWYKENKEGWPTPIADALGKVLDAYEILAGNTRGQRDILRQLRTAMGLIPKSEKGSADQK